MTMQAERGRPPVGPSGQSLIFLRVGWIVGRLVGCLAWVLDADEHGAFVRSHEGPGDFALFRTDQEAANFSAFGIGAQHLVVAEPGIGARVDRRGRHVGLYPKPAAGRHVNAVGRAELVAVDVRAIGYQRIRVAGENEDFPFKVRLGPVLVVFPSNDVSVVVDDARDWLRPPVDARPGDGGAVGIVDRRRSAAAPVVVGERGDRGERLREMYRSIPDDPSSSRRPHRLRHGC